MLPRPAVWGAGACNLLRGGACTLPAPFPPFSPKPTHTYSPAPSTRPRAPQFGGQAPGTSEEERQWAFRKFGFEFPVMDKIEVRIRQRLWAVGAWEKGRDGFGFEFPVMDKIEVRGMGV